MNFDLFTITTSIKLLIEDYHTDIINSIEEIELKNLIERANPLLLIANYSSFSPKELIDHLLTIKLQESAETKFGTVMENITICVAQMYGAKKSILKGIDLELDRNSIHYIIQGKSSKYWSNSGSLESMKANFKAAKEDLKEQYANIEAINGCCYGSENIPAKDGYKRLCGQEYWELLTNDPNFYRDILPDIISIATPSYRKNRDQAINALSIRLLTQFNKCYCTTDGLINWKQIAQDNSGSQSNQMENIAIVLKEVFQANSATQDKDFIVRTALGKMKTDINDFVKAEALVKQRLRKAPFSTKGKKVFYNQV